MLPREVLEEIQGRHFPEVYLSRLQVFKFYFPKHMGMKSGLQKQEENSSIDVP